MKVKKKERKKAKKKEREREKKKAMRGRGSGRGRGRNKEGSEYKCIFARTFCGNECEITCVRPTTNVPHKREK